MNKPDDTYTDMANRLRSLAIDKYGCTEFTALTEGQHEVAISYWENQDQIKQWKQDAEHLLAQDLGQHKWYRSYQVQIVKILREYSNDKIE